MRAKFKGVLDALGAWANRSGLEPNTITLLGLAGSFIGAFFLAWGSLPLGGIIILLMGLVDAVDGSMARQRGEPMKFGAFVDSVTDRYVELVIYLGLLIHFLRLGDPWTSGTIFLAAGGSVLVSYVKARAEGLGFEAKGGILTRMERYMVLVPSLVFGFPKIGIAAVALLANVTALQRIVHVRKQARGR
jgi:CDP-diacylglycerol--glycerol-3-phosphate 3-phosphatidyltransferase